MSYEVAIIGGGVVDIPLQPVDAQVFSAHSTPLERIAITPGGDAVNEAIALARLGHSPLLISKVGADPAGDYLLKSLSDVGVNTDFVTQERGLDTGINVVLVSPQGERRFITNRNGSLRRLEAADILPAIQSEAFRSVRVACLASLFVSPMLPLNDTAALLRRMRARHIVLCADTTRPKHGETVADMAGVLSQLDYFFPNLEEARLITGAREADAAAEALLATGLGCAVIKLGGKGCLIRRGSARLLVPAYNGADCVDTTGAGDTFAAGFIAGLLEGRSVAECARFACAAASLCVEAVGAGGRLTGRAAVDARFDRMP